MEPLAWCGRLGKFVPHSATAARVGSIRFWTTSDCARSTLQRSRKGRALRAVVRRWLSYFRAACSASFFFVSHLSFDRTNLLLLLITRRAREQASRAWCDFAQIKNVLSMT